MSLYRKVVLTGRAALAAAASETLDAELRRYAALLRKAKRADEAALALYWARVVADAGPAADISSAVYAALRIGAAVERANAERAFTTPVVKSRKANADRRKATAASARSKVETADAELLEHWRAFGSQERQSGRPHDPASLRRKFLLRTHLDADGKVPFGGSRKRRFRNLVPRARKVSSRR
jgi:hypothetical protein